MRFHTRSGFDLRPPPHRQIAYWLHMVPTYWENPEVNPEFQTVLDGTT